MRGIDRYSPSQLRKCLVRSFWKFKKVHGVYPNLVDPLRFNEKIVWFKFFAEIKVPETGNKLLTESFIPEECKAVIRCPEILWHSTSSTLPANEYLMPGSYYLKSNHGSRMSRKIHYPLSRDDRTELEQLAAYWLNKVYGFKRGEWWYDEFQKEIFIEKSISEDDPSVTWCFFVFRTVNPFTAVVTKKPSGTETIWLDESGTPLAIQKNPEKLDGFELPENYLTIQQLALEVGRAHAFVRVDFLLGPKDEIFLGEMTFSPGNGHIKRPATVDKALGELWVHHANER